MSRSQEKLAEMESFLKTELLPWVEKTIREFQEAQVRDQARLNLVWNATNAILKVYLDKGLVTGEEVAAAGAALAMEAQANLKATRVAVSMGQMPKTLAPTPLEVLREKLSEAVTSARKELASEGES